MRTSRPIYLLAALLLAVLVMTSCDAKRAAIKDLETLTEQLEQQSANYDRADWEKAKDQYNDIRSRIAEVELTEEEQGHVDELKKRCAAAVAHSAVNDILGNFGDLGAILQSLTDGEGLREAADLVLGGVSKGMQGLTEQLKKIKKEDIERTANDVRSVLNELSRLSDDLEESLGSLGVPAAEDSI